MAISLRQYLDIAGRRSQSWARRSYYAFVYRGGKASWPRFLAFPLTAQCNYRCGFCEIIGTEHALKAKGLPYHANPMTVEHIQPLDLFVRGVDAVDFGGLTGLGEPLLSPHLMPIIHKIRQLGRTATLRVTTNGYLLKPEVADALIQQSPLSVTFSLHAASAQVYSQNMGKHFDQVVENIRYFCRQASRVSNASTAINFGLGKFNYMDADKIITLAKDLGIGIVCIYPYYKSPNKFMEDVSLYSDPDLANRALDAAYRLARQVGQPVSPSQPAYLRPDMARPTGASTYRGGCFLPFENFILKSVPQIKDRMGFCVCNRIVLFTLRMDQEVTFDDILWMWNHPALNALRFPQEHVPEICQFCKSPATSWLRSLDQDAYKRQRDQAVQEHLARYQADKFSPSQSIELLSGNIFSVD